MNAAAEIAPTVSDELFRENTRREIGRGIAADMIERGLQSKFCDLTLFLAEISDAELIGRSDTLHSGLQNLCRDSGQLLSKLWHAFRASECGGAAMLKKRRCQSLDDEVEFYRQEQFWLRSDNKSYIETETLITELYDFYARAEHLMRQIDHEQSDYRVESRMLAPKKAPNPYETL